MTYWDNFVRSHCYPDCSCEFMAVDSWIIQPMAFWSSLVYLLPIYFINRKLKEKTATVHLWNTYFVVLTISSLFCHASFLRVSVAMDFASIGVIMGFFSLIHFLKLETASRFRRYLAFAVFFISQTLIYYFMGKWPKIAVCLFIYCFAFYEIIQSFGKKIWKARSLQISIILLLSSFLLFVVDELKLFYCDPYGWLQGHTLWHFGTAWSAYYFAKWRFIDDKTS